MARSALPRVPGGRELTLQASVPTPHPPAPFSFEAGGEGGWRQKGGVEAFQPTSECPFLLGWLPTLAWPTGPHKALPVSLAAPHPTPTPTPRLCAPRQIGKGYERHTV